MDVSGQSTQVLDQRFFHITGLALVLGTLVAGAITLWLANDLGKTQARLLLGTTYGSHTTLPTTERPTGQIAEVSARLQFEQVVSNSQ
jgi:hypothetical protein